MMRILILEPYFGGSHQQWLAGLQKYVEAEYTVLTLPARKWKLRMQLAAYWFVGQINRLPLNKRRFTVVLCTAMVDVAVLRANLWRIDGWHPDARILCYFHENQFAYPSRISDSAWQQFAAINVHTAVAADGIAFNSLYNLQSFVTGCADVIAKVRGMDVRWLVDEVREKAVVLYPGVDFTLIDSPQWRNLVHQPPVIVWNHRWEHDKNPEEFVDALGKMARLGADFRLLLLGQFFHFPPEGLRLLQKQLGDKIWHCGFMENYGQYAGLLRQGDIVVSTSRHEFFGIAIVEAVRAGCRPVVPRRLSYPELFGEQACYPEKGLAAALTDALNATHRLQRSQAMSLTDRFHWLNVKESYRNWLQGRD
jgi:glycosyltransferase involved in cell wall biosynthesis